MSKEKERKTIEELLAKINKESRKIKKVRGDFSEMIFYTFRYCLGRQTFAPSSFSGFLRLNIDLIHSKDIRLMIREIGEYSEKGYLGMRCHIETWGYLQRFLIAQKEKRKDDIYLEYIEVKIDETNVINLNKNECTD
jgi:hypothetical protein